MTLATITCAAVLATQPAATPPPWFVEHDGVRRLARPARSVSVGVRFPEALGILSPDPLSAVVTLAGLSTPGLSFTHPLEYAGFATDPEIGLSRSTFDSLLDDAEHLFLDPRIGEAVPLDVLNEIRAAGIWFDAPTQAQLDRARDLLGPATFFGRFFSARLTHPIAVVAVTNLRTADQPPKRAGVFRVGETAVLFDIAFFVAEADREPQAENADAPPDPAREAWLARELALTYAVEMGRLRWDQLDAEIRAAFEQAFWPEGRRPERGDVVSPTALQSPQHDFAEAFALALFYPQTFETRPVFAFDLIRPWTNTPEPEPILERLRFIDALLAEDDRSVTRRISALERDRRVWAAQQRALQNDQPNGQPNEEPNEEPDAAPP